MATGADPCCGSGGMFVQSDAFRGHLHGHRESVKAGVRLAVKRVLKRNDVRSEDLERFVELVLEQAEALYGDWPRAA